MKLPGKFACDFQMELTMSSSKKSMVWNQWAGSPSVVYLNLIDYERKKDSLDSVPWIYVPFTPHKIYEFCRETIYNQYKPYMMERIMSCESNKLISDLLQKILRVAKLYEIICDPLEAENLYHDLLHCLMDKSCEDIALVVKLWTIICGSSDLTKVAVFERLIGRHRKRKSSQILKYILKIAFLAKFSFWGAWRLTDKLEHFPFCPVTSAILSGNVDQMTTLLQYGFEQNSQRLCTYDKYFLSHINSMYAWLKKPLKRRTTRRSILTESLLFLVQIANCRSYSKRLSMIKCLHLLWDVIPVPFITKSELQNEVHRRYICPPRFTRMSYFPSTQDEFLRLCEFYESVFPIECRVLQPRTLQHLSKCAVRKCLQMSWQLPHGMKVLPVPDSIQTYLMCSE